MNSKIFTHKILEKHKEIAEKRGPPFDNIENHGIAQKVQENCPVFTIVNTLTETHDALPNTPTKATSVLEVQKSIKIETNKTHANPTHTHDGSVDGEGMISTQPLIKASTFNFGENRGELDRDVNSKGFSHLRMTLFRSDIYNRNRVLARKFEIWGNKMVEVPDEAGQKFWDDSINLYSGLPESTQASWAMSSNCALEEYGGENSAHGDGTHRLIEYRDLGIRYSFKFYRGIYTWRVRYLNSELNSSSMAKFRPQSSTPMQKMSHPFYTNMLIPQTNWDFLSCEALAKNSWGQFHKGCSHGHFRVNIYVDTMQCRGQHTIPTMNNKYAVDLEPLDGLHAKFISHRVCGHALLVDLFRVMRGCMDGKNGMEPEDWQCLSEVLWSNNEISGKPRRHLGNSYTYGMLKTPGRIKTRIVDAAWFSDGSDYVWLLPTRKDCLRGDSLDSET